eukprot:13959191-Ditylum_brightwellii.AAC.1
MMLWMLSLLEEMDRSSKSLIAYMSWSHSLIAASLCMPFGVFNALDLPEPLLFRNTMCWLNVFPARFSKVALVSVM